MKLLIKQPKTFQENYEIYSDSKIFGRLNCKGLIRSQAFAEAEGKKWKFEQKGLFNTRVLIKPENSDTPIAEFHSGAFSSGGTLKLNGKEFKFKSTSWWKSNYIWTDGNNKEIIRYKTGGMLKMNGEVEVDVDISDPNNLLLILLGLYQVKLINDATSAAVAAS